MVENWLPHLNKCIPKSVSADKLSMYTIALEGWRRGLPLKFFTVKYGSKVEINYSFNYKGREYKFAVSKGEAVSKEAMRICKDKGLTKEYLIKANVSIPKGNVFSKDTENQAIIQYADSIGYPVVLKPSNANLGKGVIPNITNKMELEKSLLHVRNTLGYKEVIVEQHIDGEEYRVYVIDNHVVAAMNRVPANVTGDGKHTIRELIDRKNEERKLNPNFRGRTIKIDSEVRKYVTNAGYTLDSILENGEKLFLRKNSNISSGGESIDVTDHLTEQMKRTAVEAMKAIPGLPQCGVDMIINEKEGTGAVIELNTRPGIGGHLFPQDGQARDIPKAVMDYYFPETKDTKIDSNFYFDYKSVVHILNSGIAKEVTVPALPKVEVIDKVIYLKGGNVQTLAFKRLVQRKALSNRINGFVRNSTKGSIQIIAKGTSEEIQKFIEEVKTTHSEEVTVEWTDRKWNDPIKVGFEIRTLAEKRKRPVKKKTSPVAPKSQQPVKKVEPKELTLTQKAYKKFGDSPVWKIYKQVKQLARR